MKLAFVDYKRPDRVQFFLKYQDDFVMISSETAPNLKIDGFEMETIEFNTLKPKEVKRNKKPDLSFYKSLNGNLKSTYEAVEEVVLSGVLRGSAAAIHACIKEGITWWNIDNGYLGKDYRVSVNETAPTEIIEGSPRFDHKIKLTPWKGGKGEYIIILPPSPYYREVFGEENFLQKLVDDVSQLTDKPIIVRPKVLDISKRSDWNKMLSKAYCVITWGSALALYAMIKGVPTISLGWCPAKPASFNLEDLETSAFLREPDREAILNSLTWYCYNQKELPLAYSILRDKLRIGPVPFTEKTLDYFVPPQITI